MAIDDPFPYDFEDLVERGLRPYRPVLPYLVLAQFRTHLDVLFRGPGNLAPWSYALDRAGSAPPASADGLTSAQLVLLRSGRPTRAVEAVANDLMIHLDGGSEETDMKAREVLLLAAGCLEDLRHRSPGLPEPDPDACARELTRFIDLAIVALYASTIGELFVLHQGRFPAEDSEESLAVSSSDVPSRPIGVISLPSFANATRASSETPAAPIVGVLMKPGLTEFTRMLRGSSSAASTRAKDFTAAFDAEYALMPALPLSLAMDVVKTIAPPSRTKGARRCTVKNAPLVFTAKNEPGPTS